MKKILLTFIILFGLNVNAQFSENFDASTTLPTGWTTINGGDVGTATTGQFRVFTTTAPALPATPQYHSASNSVEITYTATAHDDYLVTPMITVTAGVSDRLTYWVKNQDPLWIESYAVKLSTFGNTAADFTTVLVPSGLAPNDWTQVTIDLTPYVGSSVYIGFHATGTDKFRLIFDDITNDTTPACAAPTAVTASAVTTTSATISWTAPTAAPANGYQYYYSTTNTAPTATTVASGTTAAGVVTTNLTSLTTGSSYYVWVRSVCSGTSSSAWSASPAMFNTTEIPGCGTLVAPANLATNVAVSYYNDTTTATTRRNRVALSWTAPTTGGATTGYNIYWGTSAATMAKLNTTPFVGVAVNITGIVHNTTYFWKIVPVNAGGEATGCVVQSFTTGPVPVGCMAGSLYPAATFTPTTCDGTTENVINADAWSSEYSNVAVTAGQNYEFNSSVATDFLSISTDAGVTAAAGGITPLLWTATVAGTVRFYIHSDANCSTQSTPQTDRTRSVYCGAGLATASFDVTSLNVYPSRVKDFLNVSFDKNISSIAIYNILGQEVITKNVDATESRIDMSNLTSGTYLVKVTSENQVKTIKVVKE